MTLWLVLALAALTYLSRAAALVLLPRPTHRFEAILQRVPAPLFAGFAAISLVTDTGEVAPAETLAAVVAALAAARTRSLLVILGGGLTGYVAVIAARSLFGS
jgi:branched-subunit amino acid transport protein